MKENKEDSKIKNKKQGKKPFYLGIYALLLLSKTSTCTELNFVFQLELNFST